MSAEKCPRGTDRAGVYQVLPASPSCKGVDVKSASNFPAVSGPRWVFPSSMN